MASIPALLADGVECQERLDVEHSLGPHLLGEARFYYGEAYRLDPKRERAAMNLALLELSGLIQEIQHVDDLQRLLRESQTALRARVQLEGRFVQSERGSDRLLLPGSALRLLHSGKARCILARNSSAWITETLRSVAIAQPTRSGPDNDQASLALLSTGFAIPSGTSSRRCEVGSHGV